MGGIFGSNDTPAAPPPPPAPTIDTGAVTQAAAEERKRRSMAQGRASNMLTEVGSQDDVQIARKKLLGS